MEILGSEDSLKSWTLLMEGVQATVTDPTHTYTAST
eukprot:s888_g11.t1